MTRIGIPSGLSHGTLIQVICGEATYSDDIERPEGVISYTIELNTIQGKTGYGLLILSEYGYVTFMSVTIASNYHLQPATQLQRRKLITISEKNAWVTQEYWQKFCSMAKWHDWNAGDENTSALAVEES